MSFTWMGILLKCVPSSIVSHAALGVTPSASAEQVQLLPQWTPLYTEGYIAGAPTGFGPLLVPSGPVTVMASGGWFSGWAESVLSPSSQHRPVSRAVGSLYWHPTLMSSG